jgi:hypothetical protein
MGRPRFAQLDPILHLPISLRLNFKQIVCHAGGTFFKEGTVSKN